MRAQRLSIGPGRPVPGNVPAAITSFVGRDAELTRIGELLAAARLVTLTGVGGVGKTRLATRAAGEFCGRFRDGVWIVELAALRDPALLPHTIVDGLGISQRSARQPMTALETYLRERDLLLILDNCEHLLDAVAAVVDRLLGSADRLRVLTTSRQRIGVTGEALVQVPPLPVPPAETLGVGSVAGADDLMQFPAVRLFAERAATVADGFCVDATNAAAVSTLCQRLEGIPLALELAAVRLRLLPVDDLAARLEDRFALLTEGGRTAPARHRTLRSTIDWSHELCTPDEQRLWARLSLFSGAFDLEAAQAVCADELLPAERILDTLAGLIDKSIVIAEQAGGHARFRVLETIREYGLTRLAESGRAVELRLRHRDWYLEVVRRACAAWFGPEQQDWCTRLRLELANLRAALEFSMAASRGESAGLVLVGRPWFLWVCLYLAEGRHWLDQALATEAPEGVERLRAMTTTAYVASLQGDREAAEALLAACDEMVAAYPDPFTAAYVEHTRGLFLLFFGADAECAAQLTEALRRYDKVEVPEDLRMVAQIQLGLTLVFDGEVAAGAERFEQCRRQCAEAGEQWLLSYALYGLALARFADGDFAAALSEVRASLAIKQEFGDTLGLAMALDLAAWIKAEQGERTPAAVLLGSAGHLWRTFGAELFGSRRWLAYRRRCEEETRVALGDGYDAAYARGAVLPVTEAIALLDQRPDPESPLSPREWQVAQLIAQGLANKAIAAELHVSPRTAETHVQHILTKLDFSSRAQIANWVGERHARVVPTPSSG